MKIVMEIDPDVDTGHTIKFTPSVPDDPRITAALDRLETAVRVAWRSKTEAPPEPPSRAPRRRPLPKKSTAKKPAAKKSTRRSS